MLQSLCSVKPLRDLIDHLCAVRQDSLGRDSQHRITTSADGTSETKLALCPSLLYQLVCASDCLLQAQRRSRGTRDLCPPMHPAPPTLADRQAGTDGAELAPNLLGEL
jgi:hypothetical protein